jgi:hypothetical protein
MVVGSVHAGHGGAKVNGRWTDSGAVGSGYQEADVARTITDKMNKIMKVRNVTDNTSRTSNDIIRGQAAGINASPNGYQISNHLNAFNGKATGVEVLYGSDSEKAMAAKLSAAIAKALGLPDRGAKDGKWLGIATMTSAGKKALLIEWGFIDNAGDMKKLMANMDKAIAEVCNILGYKATSNQTPSKPEKVKITQGSSAKIEGLAYRVHVQSDSKYTGGTLGYVKEGETAGTTGKALRVEWLEVLYNKAGSPIEIDTHVQGKGWLGYRKGSQGTRGESRRMEAIKVRIADAKLAKTHDIEYRTHIQSSGWTKWSKNGEVSGTTGKAKRLEAVQIRLVKKK